MINFILIASSFIAALISGSAGFGGSLLLLPVVAACVGAEVAVPVLTIAQLIGNLARMTAGWRQIHWREVGWFCITALPLAALGAFGFSVLPNTIVTRCIGAVLILFVILKYKNILKLRGGKKTSDRRGCYGRPVRSGRKRRPDRRSSLSFAQPFAGRVYRKRSRNCIGNAHPEDLCVFQTRKC